MSSSIVTYHLHLLLLLGVARVLEGALAMVATEAALVVGLPIGGDRLEGVGSLATDTALGAHVVGLVVWLGDLLLEQQPVCGSLPVND